jgi:hypothetical protein
MAEAVSRIAMRLPSKLLSPLLTRPIVYSRNDGVHHVYTDASLHRGRAGIGINYQSTGRFENYGLAHDMRPYPQDSNRSELAAIFVALMGT